MKTVQEQEGESSIGSLCYTSTSLFSILFNSKWQKIFLTLITISGDLFLSLSSRRRGIQMLAVFSNSSKISSMSAVCLSVCLCFVLFFFPPSFSHSLAPSLPPPSYPLFLPSFPHALSLLIILKWFWQL